MTLPKGTRLGPYEVVSPLGAGGMGEVYRALDTRLGRRVAIKVLYPDFAQDENRLRRLVAEARAASALNHPNIVTVHEMGESERGPYIVTELVEGETIRELLHDGPLPLSLALDVGIQSLAGLAKAHEIGLVHRDLKPENVMVTRDGFVKILDFGLAKLSRPDSGDSRVQRLQSLGVSVTEQGTVMGTAAYMSPEQVRGESVTPLSDLFSLAVVLHEMISGRSAFQRPNPVETMTAILRDAPEALSGIPPELAAILDRALDKDPANRPADAHAFETALRSVRRAIDSKSEASRPGLPVLEMRTPDRISRDTAVTRPRSSRKRRIAGAAALGILLVAGVWYAATRTPARLDSVAVLPFQSTDGDVAFVGEGMTESLTNCLSQVPGLRVVPRTVAAAFRGQESDPQKVGRALKVQALLTGRVARREDRLVVQAELVEVARGRQFWGGRFDEPLGSVLALQNAVATQVSERLRGALTGEQKKRVTRHGTEDPEAYRLYLMGRYSAGRGTEEATVKAIELFEQSIAKDPAYPQAHAGLADASLALGAHGLVSPRATAARAAGEARKAIALDPELAEPNVSLGLVKFLYEWDWAGADAAFRRAIAVNPSSAEAHHGYGRYLLAMGRFDDSRAELRRAQELDPVSLLIGTDVGAPDLFQGRLDAALRQFRAVTALDASFAPARIYAGLALVLLGRPTEAVPVFQKASELAGMPPEGILVRAYAAAVGGDRPGAYRILEEFKALSNRRGVSPFHAAILYTALDDRDEALRWLERGYAERSPDLVYLAVHPMVDKLGSDPRFADLLRRMNLSRIPRPSKGATGGAERKEKT